jgi:peptidyl-prolyl cis-trans isomerase SurA
MKLLREIVLIVLLLTIGFGIIYAEVVDRVVAKVGREVILMSDLIKYRQQLEQAQMIVPGTSDADILRDMIERKLVLQTAKTKGYVIEESKIRQNVDAQINTLINHLGSESSLRNELKAMGMTLSDYKNHLESMFREQKLNEMIIQNEVANRVHVTDSEIVDYYSENFEELPQREEVVELWMLRREIKASDRTKKEIFKEINKIYDKVREGKDFEQLARDFSDCPSSKQGGDLGFFGRGQMIKEFEDVAFKLKPGETSNIVETHFGYHIIKMTERDEDDIRASHILKMVVPTEQDVEDSISFCRELLEKLRTGEGFREIAKLYSDDESREMGGIIGEFSEEKMPEMFRDNLQLIKVGEFTELIQQDQNIYIFGKTKLVPVRPYDFAEIKDKLKDIILEDKKLEYYEQWMESLKEQSYVEIFLE